jgi:hypothetical protein
MNSWCDKLASTPAVGIKLDKLFAPSTLFLDAMTPVTSKWVEHDKPTFNIDLQDSFRVTIGGFDGFTYSYLPDALAVEFQHKIRLKGQSGGPPVAQMLSTPLPYTELLEHVWSRLEEAARLVTADQDRKLVRLGIVSNTLVSEEDAPPGVLRFIEYFSRPWVEMPYFNVQVTGILPLAKGANFTDRCIHMFSKAEDDDQNLLNIRLDYQRTFNPERNFSISSLSGLVQEVKKSALAYFEDVGQGERFDESLRSSTVK